ncbi:uncharacterized protein LOC144440291 [Glandiceps talaboti]
MAEAIKDYVNKMVHGQYLVKLILLQNEKKTYNLAVDCVESNRHRESILYLDEYDYKKGDSMPISRDVIVKKGDAIKVTVAQDLVLKDYEFVILWFQPYQDNHRTFDVMPRKPKVKQLRGRVDFIDVTTDAIHDNLYFSILVNMDEDQCGVPCSADNSVSMLQWSGHVLTDGIPKVKKQKRNKNSRSVLILNDEWGTSKGGLSSVHRILTQTLSEAGFSVYVTALAVTEEENHDAEEKGIRLIVAKGRDTLSNPTKKDWLTESHAYHFPSLEKIPNLEIIIGHVPLTSAAALSIRRERLEGCQVFLVNHVIPQSTDIHKDSWDLGKIEAKTSDIVEQAVDADIIFSVGPRIRDTFGNEFRKRENINHKYYIPYPEDDFFQVKIEKPEKSHPCHILTFGRVSCDSNLKGFDIIAEALGKVADDIYKTSDKSLVWKIRGIPEDQQHRTVSCLNEHVKSPNLNIHPEIYGTHKQIVDDIKSSHLFVMPSRSEPFGMVAFEVMAAGLPLLVTRNSGIADYMKVHFPEYKESMIVEVGVNEKDRPGDINKWAEKITKVLMKDYEAKFTEAQIIKKRLQEKKDSDEECDFKKMVNGLI